MRSVQSAVMRTRGPSLTANEQRVASLIARGYTTTEIARELGVTANTAKTYVSTVLQFMKRRAAQEAGEAPRLTRREQQVAQLVHEGASDAQVARQLGISMRTAEDHVYRILTKLGYQSRSEITGEEGGPPSGVARP